MLRKISRRLLILTKFTNYWSSWTRFKMLLKLKLLELLFTECTWFFRMHVSLDNNKFVLDDSTYHWHLSFLNKFCISLYSYNSKLREGRFSKKEIICYSYSISDFLIHYPFELLFITVKIILYSLIIFSIFVI